MTFGKNPLSFCMALFFSQTFFADANTITGQNEGREIYQARPSPDGNSIEIHSAQQPLDGPGDDQGGLGGGQGGGGDDQGGPGGGQGGPGGGQPQVNTPTTEPIPNFFAPEAPAAPQPPLVLTPINVPNVGGEWVILTQAGQSPVIFGLPEGGMNFQATLNFLNAGGGEEEEEEGEDEPDTDATLPAVNPIALLHTPQLVTALQNLFAHPLITPWNLRYYGWGSVFQDVVGSCWRRGGWNRAEYHTANLPVATQPDQPVPIQGNLVQTTTNNNGDVTINTARVTGEQQPAGQSVQVMTVAPNSYQATGLMNLPLTSCRDQAAPERRDRRDDEDEDDPGNVGSGSSRSGWWGSLSSWRIVSWATKSSSSKNQGQTADSGQDKKRVSIDPEWGYSPKINESYANLEIPMGDEPKNLMELKVELDLSFEPVQHSSGQSSQYMSTTSEKVGTQDAGTGYQPAGVAY